MSSRPRRAAPDAARRGFTLPEILIVIVLISVLALIGLPRFTGMNARRLMESARLRTASALATARQAAIQKGSQVEFKLDNHRVTVRVTGSTADLVSPLPLDTLYGVRAEPTSLTIKFSSRGFATNVADAGQVIILRRANTSQDTVFVTKFGMVKQ